MEPTNVGLGSREPQHPGYANEYRDYDTPRYEDTTTASAVLGGSAVEAIGGAGALVLSILGLAGIASQFMLTIAVLCVGGALFSRGVAVATRARHLARGGGLHAPEKIGLFGGISAETLGGAAGIVLGILALVGIWSSGMLSVATIVFGGTLLVASGATAQLGGMRVIEHRRFEEVARESASGAAATEAVVGICAVVLGILGLFGVHQLLLTLIAVLASGAAVMLAGGTISAHSYAAVAPHHH